MYHQRGWGALSALAVVILLAGPARADIGFGPRPTLNIQVRFENLEDYPRYDFYLKYGLGTGNPSGFFHLTRVHPATLTLLEGNGSRMTEVYLLAAPRGQSVSPPQGQMDNKWLTEAPSGALRSTPLPTHSPGTTLSEGLNGYSLDYRVHIEGDHLEVTCVGQTQSRPAATASVVFWILLGVLALGGLGLSVVITVGILIWSRRSGRPVQS
jgi:hypothetical protein